MTENEQRRMAALEVAQARAGQSKAELERDVIAAAALNQANHRAVDDAASAANMRAHQAESQARSMATSASVARADAASERSSASSARFTATVALVLFLGGATVAIALYMFWWQPNQTVVLASPQKAASVTINTPERGRTRERAPHITINNRIVNPPPAASAGKPDTNSADPAASDATASASSSDPAVKPDPADTPSKVDPLDTSGKPGTTDTPSKPAATDPPRGDAGSQGQ
jgi:hypothetical protein